MAEKERAGIRATTRSFRLTGITPLLGTIAANPHLYTQFIAAKIPDDEEDSVNLPSYADEESKGLTVFPVDSADVPVILGYQLKGFFKEALTALKPQNNVGTPKKRVDNFLFLDPETLYLYRDGELIREADDRKERPLRTTHMGSELVGLTSSERINTPWETEFDVTLIDNESPGSRAKTRPLTWDEILTALDYGSFKGLLQWRNAGWGRFSWEEITENA